MPEIRSQTGEAPAQDCTSMAADGGDQPVKRSTAATRIEVTVPDCPTRRRCHGRRLVLFELELEHQQQPPISMSPDSHRRA